MLLTQYGCKCDGKGLPRPYASQDDMPTYYITPTGLHFPVQPPYGTHYPPCVVKAILSAAKLNVVVEMKRGKGEPAS